MAIFHERGVRFQYPENWTLERDTLDDGWTVTVQSPATAFLTLALHGLITDPGDLADATLAALSEEYKELDSDPFVGTLAGAPAVGHDVRFFSLDLTNTCRIRAIDTTAGALLVLAQSNDLEEQNALVLQAMGQSLTLDDEEPAELIAD